MSYQYWSWILTAFGLTGFVLAGRKIWWCWYINIACQILWFTYAIVTEQLGFIVAAIVYTVVFSQNAIRWTKEHRSKIVEPTQEPVKEKPHDTIEWCAAYTGISNARGGTGHKYSHHVHKCVLIMGRHPIFKSGFEHWCDCGGSWMTLTEES